MARCYNKNLPEYKALEKEFATTMMVDGIINRWQASTKSDDYPTVAQAKKIVSELDVVANTSKQAFGELILSNLEQRGLTAWSRTNRGYLVAGADKEASIKSIYRFLEFSNIPADVISLSATQGTFQVEVNDGNITPRMMEESRRNPEGTHTLDVLGHLSRSFPQLEIQIMDEAQAAQYYRGLPKEAKANVPFEDIKSFYYNGKAVLIKGRVTSDIAIEEVLHPFVDAIAADNPELYDSLISEAKENFPALAEEIENIYTASNGFSQEERDKEIVTQALTKHFKTDYERTPTTSFKQKIKDLLKWFGNLIKNLHKYITGNDIPAIDVDKIKPNTKLSDLARMINTPELKFNLSTVEKGRVKYALSPEKTESLKKILSRANVTDIQKKIVDKLFSGAVSSAGVVPGLPAGPVDTKEGSPILILNEEDHVYYDINDFTKQYVSTTTAVKGKMKNQQDVAENLAVGNDFDNIVEAILLYESFDSIKDKMERLSEEDALKAFYELRGHIRGNIQDEGDILIPQVLVHYDNPNGPNIAGAIDVLAITPQGRLKIIDIKTGSKRYLTTQQDKYTDEWPISSDSILAQYGVNMLSMKAQHALQVNLYKRMLENMGYEFVSDETATSTYHIWVDIQGKGKDKKWNGNYELEGSQFHPLTPTNIAEVNAIVPVDVNQLSQEELKEIFRNSPDANILQDQDYVDGRRANTEYFGVGTDDDLGGFEMKALYESIENYKKALITRRDVISTVKKTVFMDRSKEEALERISGLIATATVAVGSTDREARIAFTEFVQDAITELEKYEKYLLDKDNAKNSDYITKAINYQNFARTFEGLKNITETSFLGNQQKSYLLKLQNILSRLTTSTPERLSIVDEAVINYVRGKVQEYSTKDWSTYKDPITGKEIDPLEALMRESVDTNIWDYLTRDTNTSKDTLLAVMKKIWHEKRQVILDNIQQREGDVIRDGSVLKRLMPGASDKEIFSYMVELDENGNHTGELVKKFSPKYTQIRDALYSKLVDEQNQWLEYIPIDDLSNARQEDIEFNKNLFKNRQAYYKFKRAEDVENGELVTGEYHAYDQEYIDARSKVLEPIVTDTYVEWVPKSGVSKADLTSFRVKYQINRPVNKPVMKNGEFTGRMLKTDKGKWFPKGKYVRKLEETYVGKGKQGENMLNPKYEAIINPNATDAISVAKRTFYFTFMRVYGDMLDKLEPNVANYMQGKQPRVAGNLAKSLQVNKSGFLELWSRTVRSMKDFVSPTTRLTSVNVDEQGNVVSSIPMMYVGQLKNQEVIDKLEKEIQDLKTTYATTPNANSETYNRKLFELESRLNAARSKPGAEELSFDLVATLLKFSAMAENYEVMSSIEDTMLAFQQVIENRDYIKKGKGRKLVRRGAAAVGAGDLVDAYTQKRAYTKMSAEKFMEMVFYDDEDATKDMWDKAVEGLLQYTSLSYVGFNVFGNFNNYVLGRLNNGIEMMGQRYVSRNAYIRARKEYNHRAIPDMLRRASYLAEKYKPGGTYDLYKPISKYEAIADMLRMMDPKGDIRETGASGKLKGKGYFGKGKEMVMGVAYAIQDAAEYNVQTVMGMAMVIDTYILNPTTGEVMSLYDAFQFNGDQELVLKDGFTTIVKPKKDIPTFKRMLKGDLISRDDSGNMLYDIVGEYDANFRYDLRYRIREVNKQIHGNYAREDRMVLQTYTLGKILAQFHKWVAPAVRARWGEEYYDENLGWVQGRYVSWFQFMSYLMKNASSILSNKENSVVGFMESLGYKNDGSQADERITNKVLNMHRTNGEIAMILSTYALIALLRGMWEGDDDSETIKRLKNIARFQADRAKKEMILFTPLGYNEVFNFFSSPFASTRTLGELGGAVEATWSYGKNGAIYAATDDPNDWYYNKDVFYQRGRRAGTLKVSKEWQDVVPALYTYKRWIDFIQMDNFYIK